MKKQLVFLITALLLISMTAMVSAGGETGLEALEAFESLQRDESAQEPGKNVPLLDEVMGGKYESFPEQEEGIREFSEDLDKLCGITNKDIAYFASLRDLRVAQVNNKYYKSLANTLKAKILLNPAAEEKYKNVQTILELFLNISEGGTSEEKAKFREGMTIEESRSIAEIYNLPVSFVQFIIMNENWEDESWENDGDWVGVYRETIWAGQDFEIIGIGSRDTTQSTKIADMQEKLISLGYLSGKADGIFGPRTQAALLEFQMANGLIADGTYDVVDQEFLNGTETVSRWDYGDEFWDPDDVYGYNTPDTPDVYNSPDTLDVYNSPDTPDTTASVPVYNTPDTPDVYNTPDTPDTPDVYNTPDTPDTPDVMEEPAYNTADTPVVYDTPDTPEPVPVYDTPDTPDTPEPAPVYDTPDIPDTPESVPVYDTPDTPDTPEPVPVYDTPDTPDTPEPAPVYDTPDTPDTPDYDTDD
ncbi:MAG: peptidoglycan-binding protein [Parasporobacterium sp.]|nr:peptidoglycan-binding protein [Parasporobacterium sp.]